jgi:peptidyl-prolyl cis-trans isomerase C
MFRKLSSLSQITCLYAGLMGVTMGITQPFAFADQKVDIPAQTHSDTASSVTPNADETEFPPIKPDAIIAHVNGMPITGQDLLFAQEDIGGRLPIESPKKKNDYLLRYLIDLKLVAEAAKKSGTDASDLFKKRLSYVKDKILFSEYLTQNSQPAPTESEIRAFYDESVKNLKPETEVSARHILVETEDEAKKIRDRLVKKKEDFAKVAAEVSKDTVSAADGGNVGYFTGNCTPGEPCMVPEFSKAAFDLKVGDISQPVKTQFGWHIIKLEDKRVRPAPSFAEMKDLLADYLIRKKQDQAIENLRAKAKIEKDKAFESEVDPGQKTLSEKKE